VAFWNLTDRELSLKIDGDARRLPRGKSVTLDLPPQFVWQIDGREPKTERVPSTESALEIVIRR